MYYLGLCPRDSTRGRKHTWPVGFCMCSILVGTYLVCHTVVPPMYLNSHSNHGPIHPLPSAPFHREYEYPPEVWFSSNSIILDKNLHNRKDPPSKRWWMSLERLIWMIFERELKSNGQTSVRISCVCSRSKVLQNLWTMGLMRIMWGRALTT